MNCFSRLVTVLKCRKDIWLALKIDIDFIAFQKEWRRKNAHNSTTAGCKFDMGKIEVGNGTYGTLNVHCWDNPEEHIKIGNYCSIAENVNFLLGGEHPIHRITTFPYSSHILRMNSGEVTATKGPIVVEDDVWICYGATILSGVTIGKGSVISAGSIVAKDIPPYSIVINGEVKRTRFSEMVIEKMKDVDLSLLGEMTDIDNANAILKTDISEDNVDSITSQLVR